MPTSASDPNNSSKLKKSNPKNMDDSIHSRLPSRKDSKESRIPSIQQPTSPGSETVVVRFKFLPTLWTIASLISLSVNIILIVILLVVSQTFRTLQLAATDQASNLIGGLYTNFVKMDQAHIKTVIHVEKDVPVLFNLNISSGTNVTLSQDVSINGALVTVNTGSLNINNARANIVLPAGTVLPIYIENLIVPVDQRVLVAMDVPVDVPLNQTELHEPLVGLQKVFEPWYCLVNPNASFNGQQICP